MKIERIKVGWLETNCYLIYLEKEVLIVDPGDEKEKIIDKIGSNKVNRIILTHYHQDHVQEAQLIKDFFDSQILAHRKDISYLNFSGIGVDQALKDNDLIDKELRVMHTPGHTEGSICLVGKDFIITGDTLFSDGWGRTDLPGGSSKKMKKSLERIRKEIKPGTISYPGHGESFFL